jgi:hypothetical protein
MYVSGSNHTIMLPRKKGLMKYGIVEPYQSRKLGDTLQEDKNIRILRYHCLHRYEIWLNSFFLDPQMQLVSSYFLQALKIFSSQRFTLQCLSWYLFACMSWNNSFHTLQLLYLGISRILRYAKLLTNTLHVGG